MTNVGNLGWAHIFNYSTDGKGKTHFYDGQVANTNTEGWIKALPEDTAFIYARLDNLELAPDVRTAVIRPKEGGK